MFDIKALREAGIITEEDDISQSDLEECDYKEGIGYVRWLASLNRLDRYRPTLSIHRARLISNKWKEKIYQLMLSSIEEHGDIFVVRVDLNYSQDNEFVKDDNGDISRLVTLMNIRLSSDKGKEKYDKAELVGHVMLREYGRLHERKHYHGLLLFKNVKYLGNFDTDEGIQHLIKEVWSEASNGGRVHFVKPGRVTKEEVLDPLDREAMDKLWIDYICKLTYKRIDEHDNFICSHYNPVSFKLEEKKTIVGYKDGKADHDKLNKALMKYKHSLMLRITYYQEGERKCNFDHPELINSFLMILHNTLMDSKKGGITLGCVNNRNKIWDMLIILSGSRNRTANDNLMVTINTIWSTLTDGVIGESYIRSLTYHFVIRDEVITKDNDKLAIYKKLARKLLCNEYLIPVCYYDDGSKDESAMMFGIPPRVSLDDVYNNDNSFDDFESLFDKQSTVNIEDTKNN